MATPELEITEVQAFGQRCAAIVARVTAASRLSHEVALAYNAAAVHGALALVGDEYRLRQLVPLAGLTLEMLRAAAEAVAEEAARLRAATAPRPASPAVFGYLAE